MSRAKKASEYTITTSPDKDDYLLLVDMDGGTGNTPANFKATLEDVFGNNNILVISAGKVKIRDKETPATSGDTMEQGSMFFDDTYLYIATSNNVIKRITLESF